PRRRRADLHTADKRGEVPWAAVGVIDADADRAGGVALDRHAPAGITRTGQRGQADVAAGELARDANVRKQVAAVGRDVQHDAGVVKAERTGEQLARHERPAQLEDAAVIASEAELGSTAQHAFARLAADLRLANFHTVRQCSPDRREGI